MANGFKFEASANMETYKDIFLSNDYSRWVADQKHLQRVPSSTSNQGLLGIGMKTEIASPANCSKLGTSECKSHSYLKRGSYQKEYLRLLPTTSNQSFSVTQVKSQTKNTELKAKQRTKSICEASNFRAYTKTCIS